MPAKIITKIFSYKSIQMSKVMKRKRKVKALGENGENYQEARDASYATGGDPSIENNELNDTLNRNDPDDKKNNQQRTEHKIKSGDDETVGQSIDESLPRPYQFLKFANPPLHTIFMPHFTVKSITFVMTIIYIIMFIVLLVYSYTKPIQNQLTWNCSIFQLQNKYYPRIRYSYQFWRIPVSGIFHSNIAHFILDIIGFQIYGYFVEWYYGKAKYIIAILLSVLFSHVFSCVIQPTTVSTLPSSTLFTILALKLYFLIQYREYKPLLNRRVFIYLLYVLILGINLIPIFVNNNVDFATHLGGFICGLLIGQFYFIQKSEQAMTKCRSCLKFGSVILLGALIIIFIALMFTIPDTNGHYYELNRNIAGKCKEG